MPARLPVRALHCTRSCPGLSLGPAPSEPGNQAEPPYPAEDDSASPWWRRCSGTSTVLDGRGVQGACQEEIRVQRVATGRGQEAVVFSCKLV
jgi:hypothetical protein